MLQSKNRTARTPSNLIWIALAAFLLNAAAPAQTRRRETSATRRARVERTIEETYTHRWEAAGGGGYLRWRSGQYLQKNDEVTFWTSATYFFNPKLGVTGGIDGAYGNAKIGDTIYNIPDPQISEYTFMAGPTFRLYAQQKTAIGVFVTAGTALGKFGGGSKGIPDVDLGLWPSSNARAAFSAGVNIDYNFFPNLAARVTPTYLGTTFGGTLQNNAGVKIGLVYRFGRIK